jgi:hypothetical protein
MVSINVKLPELYESDYVNAELHKFYHKKIRKWFYDGYLDDALKYFTVKNGKVVFGKSKDYEDDDKANMIIEHIMRSLINIFAMPQLFAAIRTDYDLSSYDFTKNYKFVKQRFRDVIKHKIKSKYNEDK